MPSLRRTVVPSLLAIGLVVAGLAAAEVRPIVEVTALPRAALESRPEVAVRGTVIRTRPAKKDIIVEDATGGIWIDVDKLAPGAGPPLDSSTILPGMEVEVVGTVSPGGFSPPMSAASVRIIGARPLPAPRPVDPERFFAGADDCRLVELTAVLQDPKDFDDRWKITMESASRLLSVEIPKSWFDVDPRSLVDAEVRVAGPTVSLFNTRGEFLRPWVFVDRPEWFSVTKLPRATDDVPKVPLDTLAGFSTAPPGGHRVRTEGTVVHAVPGKFVALQEGARGVGVVLLPEGEGAGVRHSPGDVVEVVGFLDRQTLVTTLRHALVRRVRAGEPPAPTVIEPSRILDLNRAAAASSTMARPGDYEGCLIRFRARLVQRQPVEGGGLFILESLPLERSAAGGPPPGPAPVTAELDDATWATVAAIEPGSTVEVTGIARINWLSTPVDWPPLVPRSVRLGVRGPDDVRVISGPSWWTPSRLAAVLGVTGSVLATALVWAVTLRRQLMHQKRLLAAEMRSRRDAALEFDATLRERNRLAANLHDTLQQTIVGIGLQLDACESAGGGPSPEAERHFTVARQMVSHAAKELQGSVWAMRSLPLYGMPFRDALHALVSRVAEGHDVEVSVRTAGDLGDLPEFVSGSVLLLVQEAVHNALKHGAPKRIDVTVSTDPEAGTLRAEVADDGRGFAIGTQAGPREGHFGIHGMRERAERLGGRLVVASRPGGGTTVEAIVLRRDYDGEIGTPRSPPVRDSR